MWEVILDFKGSVVHKSVHFLAYVDDVVIVEWYENAVKNMHLTDLKWSAKNAFSDQLWQNKNIKKCKPT